MPALRVDLFAGRTIEQKRELWQPHNEDRSEDNTK